MNDRNSLNNPKAVAPSGEVGGDTRMRCYPLKSYAGRIADLLHPACPHHSPQGIDRQPVRSADPIQALASTFFFTQGSRSRAGYFPKLRGTAAPPDNRSYCLAIGTARLENRVVSWTSKPGCKGKGPGEEGLGYINNFRPRK